MLRVLTVLLSSLAAGSENTGNFPFTELPFFDTEFYKYNGQDLCWIEEVGGRKAKVVQTRSPPRCRSLRYIYSVAMLEMDCGSAQNGVAKNDCPEDFKAKLCQQSGVPTGRCSFRAQTIPYGSLRQVTLFGEPKGIFWYNFFRNGINWELEPERRDFMMTDSLRNCSIDGVEVLDAPTSAEHCGAMAIQVVNNETFRPIAPYWYTYLPIPCQDHTNTFRSVLPLKTQGKTEGANFTNEDGQQAALRVSFVVAFASVTYPDGTEMCFDGSTLSGENCERSPRVKLQDTPWWDQTYTHEIRRMPRGDSAFYFDTNPRTPQCFEAEHTIQNAPVVPNARCQQAMYMYGVLGAEYICTGSCNDAVTGACSLEAMKKVCTEAGTHRHPLHCDMMIHVWTLADIKAHGKPDQYVNWEMERDANPVLYMNRNSQKTQYIYVVNETNLVKDQIPDTECYGFHVEIWGQEYLLHKQIFYPPIPSAPPKPSTILIPVSPNASYIKTPTKTCESFGVPGTTGTAHLKLHFFLMPLYFKTPQGEDLYNAEPGSALENCVNYPNMTINTQCDWWSEVKSYMENNFPHKKPRKLCFATQKRAPGEGSENNNGLECK